MERITVSNMVQHIDCRNLVIRNRDGPETYFCLISRTFIDLNKINEEIKCPEYVSILED